MNTDKKVFELNCSRCVEKYMLDVRHVANAVNMIDTGWRSMGMSLLCPSCARFLNAVRANARRLGDERETFFAIMYTVALRKQMR